MERDGEKLKEILDEMGIGYQVFADKMGKHRNTVTRWFTTHPLPVDILLKAGRVLDISIESYFPRLPKPKSQPGPESIVSEPSASHGATGGAESANMLHDCREELAVWQSRAYENLDKYNKLLEEHNQVLRRLLSAGATSEHAQRIPELSHV